MYDLAGKVAVVTLAASLLRMILQRRLSGSPRPRAITSRARR